MNVADPTFVIAEIKRLGANFLSIAQPQNNHGTFTANFWNLAGEQTSITFETYPGVSRERATQLIEEKITKK